MSSSLDLLLFTETTGLHQQVYVTIIHQANLQLMFSLFRLKTAAYAALSLATYQLLDLERPNC